VGAENLCHLPGCSADRWLLGPPPAREWDDLRLVGLKLIFLVATRAVSLLGLSRRERWWKDPESLLRHQLAVAERERPRAHSRLTRPDRALLALLAGTLVWSQRHLMIVLREYEDFYNTHRPHRALKQVAPLHPLPDGITSRDQFGSSGVTAPVA
jgi:hypothetical protein